MADNNGNKPTWADSLKAIGAAIGGEVDRHGGVKGIAGELFGATKDAAVKAGDALAKAGDEAARHVDNASADFIRKYNGYVAEAKHAETADETPDRTEGEPESDEDEIRDRMELELMQLKESENAVRIILAAKKTEFDNTERQLRAQLESFQRRRDEILDAYDKKHE